MRRIHDHHAIGAEFQNCVKPALLLGQLLIQAGIVHRDGCLVGEALQQFAVIAGEFAAINAKDIQRAQKFIAIHFQGQRNHLPQAQPEPLRNGHQIFFQLSHRLIQLLALLQQRSNLVEQWIGDAVGLADVVLAIWLHQRHERRLPIQNLGRLLQDQPQHVIYIQARSHRSADLEQVISLANSIIG